MPPLDSGAGPATGFYAVLTAAINAVMETGYISADQIAMWIDQLRRAAKRSLTPESTLRQSIDDMMRSVYRAKVEQGGLLRYHPGVERFTLHHVAPRLHAELDRRIMASADLIKLNRTEAVETTLRRFQGWATSIPPGGISEEKRRTVKEQIRKPLASLPFRERRVAVDQGHKLRANLSEILAIDGGALAGHWRSHYAQQNYDYRPEHKHYDVDDKFFVVRDNWAIRQGLMTARGYRYTDEIEAPAQKPFCRCYYVWSHSLRRLPVDMLTEKGREALNLKMAA
jgi:hypothetical protein